ncbi:hypothetical protein WMF27_31395 [Sorangium sp. So ce281]|uniref:hypothetical protein n=1 Tax=unclassified Sorangium TaxID=2621164 RepID=UPI003F631E07
MCLRHPDAPLGALCAARGPLFRPRNEASRRARSRHFGSPRHTSSRSDPASFTYAHDPPEDEPGVEEAAGFDPSADGASSPTVCACSNGVCPPNLQENSHHQDAGVRDVITQDAIAIEPP